MSWPLVPLRTVCEITMGQAPVGTSYNANEIGLPLIAGAGDFGDVSPIPKKYTNQPSKISKVDDLILCIRATIGDLNWSDKAYCLGRGVSGLRPNSEELDKHYLWHFINSNKEQLVKKGSGSTFKQVGRVDIENWEIPLPSLPEQKRIAAILDKADSLRRKNQQAIQLADKFLRAMFLDLFGDPVTNPKGWEKVKLGDVIFFAKDGPHVSPNYSEKGIPFLSTRHVRPTGVIWEDLKYITNDEARNHWKKCKPEYGDILYTKGGTTGIACPVDFKTDFAVWVHVALLRPNAKKVNFIWLAHMLNSTYCYNQSQKHTRGATNKDLGLTRMVEINMCCPPLDEQEKFVKIKESVTRVIQQNNILTEKLLFESLSQKAFAGEL